jgi:2-desacetyl-2-hydroxyethyl bacteriochlorophyllide A dehydrogenase
VTSTATEILIMGPGSVEVASKPVDEDTLGPDDLLIEARCSVISPGTELAHYRGDAAQGVLPHASRRPYPFRPGYAMAGVVVGAGPEARFEVGAPVLAHNPHAQLTVCDARQVVCVRRPTELDDTAAPFARLAQVSGVILRISAAQPGDVVAVTGLGAIGNLAAQLAQVAGMDVVGIDPSSYRREVAEACGVARTASPDEAMDALGPSGGAQLVLECSGRAGGVVLATQVAARHGEVLTVGAPWTPEPEVPASRVLANVFENYLALRSGWEWQVPRYAEPGQRSVASCTEWILGLLADGHLNTKPLVSGVVKPAEVPGAYEKLDRDPEHHMTFVIDWRQ